MSDSNSRTAVAKTFGKTVLWLLVGGVIGGIAGFGSMSIQNAGAQGMIQTLYQNFLDYALYIQIGCFLIVGLICLIFYLKAQRLVGSEDDESQDAVGRYENFAILVNTVGLVVLFMLYGLAADFRNPYFMLSTLTFLITAVLNVALEVLIIYQVKKIDPMKKGDPGDLTFTKDWMKSCDEAEKMITCKAAYETFSVMKIMIMAAFVVALLGKVSFGTGNFPIIIVGMLWLIQSLVYMLNAMKLERQGVIW